MDVEPQKRPLKSANQLFEEAVDEWLEMKAKDKQSLDSYIETNRPSLIEQFPLNDVYLAVDGAKKRYKATQTAFLKHRWDIEVGADITAKQRVREIIHASEEAVVFPNLVFEDYIKQTNAGQLTVKLEPEDTAKEIKEFEETFTSLTARIIEQENARQARALARYKQKVAALIDSRDEDAFDKIKGIDSYKPDPSNQPDVDLEKEKAEEMAKLEEEVKTQEASDPSILANVEMESLTVPKFSDRMKIYQTPEWIEHLDLMQQRVDAAKAFKADDGADDQTTNLDEMENALVLSMYIPYIDTIETDYLGADYEKSIDESGKVKLVPKSAYKTAIDLIKGFERKVNKSRQNRMKREKRFAAAVEKRKRRRARADTTGGNQRAKYLENRSNTLMKQGNKQSRELADKLSKEGTAERLKSRRTNLIAKIPTDIVNRIQQSSASKSELGKAIAFVDIEKAESQMKFDTLFDKTSTSTNGSNEKWYSCSRDKFPWLESSYKMPETKLDKRGSYSISNVDAQEFGIIDSKNKTWEDTWPVAEQLFTNEQHKLMFVPSGIAIRSLVPSGDDGGDEEEGGFGVPDDVSNGSGDDGQNPEPRTASTEMDVQSPFQSSTETTATSPGLAVVEVTTNGHAPTTPNSNETVQIGVGYGKRSEESKARTKKKKDEKAKLMEKLSEEGILNSDPVLFNKQYARCVLAEHLISIKAQHIRTFKATNSSVKFVDVAGALGPITVDEKGNPDSFGTIDDERLKHVVEELLPSFESMLRYRNTVLKVKEIEITDQLTMIGAGAKKSSKRTELASALADIKSLDIDDVWGVVDAKRMLQSENGQLPGQLYTPQPLHLPLRVSAPPRVGKSATALLMSSIAKRCGMTSLYSVAPHKTTPIAEMTKKLHRLGWRGGVVMKRLIKEINDSDLVKDTPEQQKKKKDENTHTSMRFNWLVIDDLVPTGTKSKSVCNPNTNDKSMPIDMILYSSEEATDVMKIGAVLAGWRYSKTVVFHIRDEAQSLAMGEENPAVSCHQNFIPPPLTLQYLRYYFGNLYGLNCLVTATLFPTLLEENLWGYFGSVGQNANAGLSLSASMREIRQTLGFVYLPKVVQAIKPYVSPGYIGVSHMRAWTYKRSKPAKKLQDVNRNDLPDEDVTYTVTLENGTEETRYIFHTKEIEKDVVASLQYGAAHSGLQIDHSSKPVESTAGFREEQRYREEKRLKEGTNVSQRKQKKNAIESAEYAKAVTRRGKQKFVDLDLALTGRRSKRSSNTSSSTGTGSTGSSSQSVSTGVQQPVFDKEDEPDDDDDPSDNYTPDGRSNIRETQVDQFSEMLVNTDKLSIDEHFEDWLYNAKEDNIHKFKGDDQTMETTNDKLVPMYLGALNPKVIDEHMISFVRHFGVLCHNRTKETRLPFLTPRQQAAKAKAEAKAEANPEGNANAPPAPVPLDTKTPAKDFGVAFLMYQSVFDSRKKIEESTSKFGDPIRFYMERGDTSEDGTVDDGEIEKDKGVTDTDWKPGEGAKSETKFSLAAFIYNPDFAKNLSSNAVSEGLNAEPAFRVVLYPNAETAISAIWQDYQISKIAILGYGMLSAGLTIQSIVRSPKNHNKLKKKAKSQDRQAIDKEELKVEGYDRIYCARYLALATSDDASLDKQLQIAGRTFAELKNHEAPKNWHIETLGVENIVDTLVQYSEMESLLSDINTPTALMNSRMRWNKTESDFIASDGDRMRSGTPNSEAQAEQSDETRALTLPEALKESFDSVLMTTNAYGDLGEVGVRRGDFASILGLTNAVAKQRAYAALQARKNVTNKETRRKTREERDAFARKYIADKAGNDDAEKQAQVEEELEGDQEDPEDPEGNEAMASEGVVAMTSELLTQAGALPAGKGTKRPSSSTTPSPPPKKSLKTPIASPTFPNPNPALNPAPTSSVKGNIGYVVRNSPNLPNMLKNSRGAKLKLLQEIVDFW